MNGVFAAQRNGSNDVYSWQYPTGLTGTFASTEAADSASIAASGIFGLEAADSTAFAGDNIVTGYFGELVPNAGYLIAGEAADSIVASGANIVTGALALQEQADGITFAGITQAVAADFFVAEAADSCAIQLSPVAVMVITEAWDGCVIAGTASGPWVNVGQSAGTWTNVNRGSTTWTKQ